AVVDPILDGTGAVDVLATVYLVVQIDPAEIAGSSGRTGESLEHREAAAIVAGGDIVLVVLANDRGGAQAEFVGHRAVELIIGDIGLIGTAGVERGDVFVPGVVIHGDGEKAIGRRYNFDLGGHDDSAGPDPDVGARLAKNAAEHQRQDAVFAALAI